MKIQIIFSEKNSPREIIEQKDAELKNINSQFCNGGIMAIHNNE